MTHFLETTWLVPCYGLMGAILTLPWAAGLAQRTGPRPAAYFNLLMTVLALGHALGLLNATLGQPSQQLVLPWLKVGTLDLPLVFGISTASVGAVVMITGLSLVAQCFALGYMEKDWGLGRFFAMMGFFEGAMCGLALSDSLLMSYGLLELLTLSTYLLVGFWYAQPLVVTAARDAFWTKRLGDLLLLMGVVALSTLAPSLNFQDLALWAATDGKLLSPVAATLLGLALMAGPLGKCAQFPLNLWLDEAMEGPNPASIMRNSVVVATGAWVLIKLQPVFALSPVALSTMVVLGAITALGSSWVALAQVDLKRAFSHSTSAYLGLVFMAVGMQQTEAALMLLFAHGLAKALLFMSTGSVIFTTSCQDIRELGGLWAKMPATTVAYVTGALGLVAFLPLGSLWAMATWAEALQNQPVLLAVLLAVNGLTAFNLARVFGLVFLGSPQPKSRRAPEVAWPMAVPMVSMSIITLLIPVMLHTWQWQPLTVNVSMFPLVASGGLGFVSGYYYALLRQKQVPLKEETGLWPMVENFFAHDLYLDRLYRATVVAVIEWGSRVIGWIDRNVIDAMVNLVGLGSLGAGQLLRYTNSGRSQAYMVTIMIGVIVVSLYEIITHR